MPKDRDLRRPELQELRRSSLSLRARLGPKRHASASGEAGPGGGAVKDPPGPAEPEVLPSRFDHEQPAQRAPALPMVNPPPSAGVPGLPMVVGVPRPGPLSAAPRRPWLVVVPALTLVAGLALGFAAGSARAGGERATSTRTRPPAARPASLPPTAAVPRPAASCLEAAKRGDQVIAMLVTNQRRKAVELLRPFTVASQQCRSDAGR